MPKRIALFILGVALAVGAFLLYQNLSGSSLRGGIGAGGKVDPAPSGDGGKLQNSFEGRDQTGRLEYLITAAKAPEAMKDDAGNAIPGRFKIEGPVATLFDKTGRTIEIRGDSGTVTVETGKGAASGAAGLGSLGSGSSSKGIPVRTGQLKGNVRLTIGTQPPDDPANPEKAPKNNKALEGGMRIYFDGPVRLDHSTDLSQEIVTSEGGVQVRSDRIAFNGEGLKLVFNGNAQRIETLQIDKGEEVMIRDVGKGALSMSGPATKPAGGGAGGAGGAAAPNAGAVVAPAAVPVAGAQPAAKAAQAPTTYKISFMQDVVVRVGESELISDQLILLFMAAGNGGGIVNPNAAAPADKGAAGAVPATAPAAVAGGGGGGPAVVVWPDMPAPIAPARPDDLVIRFTGPMELRPSDSQDLRLADANDVALEAVGTAEKPMHVSDPKFAAKAGRLWFHRAEERFRLEPGSLGHVEMADAKRGTVECAALDFYQADNRAELLGPGTLSVKPQTGPDGKPGKGGPTLVSWKSRMELTFEKGKTDPKNPDKEGNLLVKLAKISGAGIKSDSFDLTSDMLEVLVANVDDRKGSTTPALERLLATGNVVVNSLRGALGAAEPDGLRAPRMEIQTTPGEGGDAPVPSKLILDGGNVSAWRSSDKSKSAATQGAPGGAAGVAAGVKLWEKDMVMASKIVADLAVKPKEAKDGKESTTDAGIAGLGQEFEATHFVATDAVTVDISPPDASRRIVATTTNLEADTLAGTASLKGTEKSPVHVVIGAAGENYIDGGTMLLTHLLNQNEMAIEVPVPGKFHFALPSDKSKEKPLSGKPMEKQLLDLAWADRMTFDYKTMLAEFWGKTVAQSDGNKSDLAKLSAEKLMRVQLKRPEVSLATGANTQPAGTQPAKGSADLVLDYIYAEGNVDAGGAQLDENGEVATWMDLQAEKLTYSDTNKQLHVPVAGMLAMEDRRPEKKADTTSPKGRAVFTWKGGLEYDGPGNLITFSKGVTFDYEPKSGFGFLAGAAKTAGAAGNSPAKKGEVAHLTTDKLVATLMASTKAKGTGKTLASPVGLGANGNQELSRVDATGGAELKVGSDYLTSGESLSFDVQQNIATINGGVNRQVLLVRPGEGAVTADKVIWDMTKNNSGFEIIRPRGTILGR